MKIKARPDDADMLESDELFQMNGWLAELRDEGRAESRDEDRSWVEENSHTKPRGDGRAEARDGGRAGSRQDSHTGSRENGRPRLPDGSQAGSRGDRRAESGNGGRAKSRGEGHRRPRDDGHAGSGGGGRTRPPDNGQAALRGDGRAGPRDDGQAMPTRNGYRRPEALAATPVTAPVTRTQTTAAKTTARAVIGDELRLPIMWCEMGSCISWFAHPAAFGEADIRARAIDAGWRVDAVGLLACPQCVQTAPGF